MSSPKKMGFIGKSAVGDEELHGEEYQHVAANRAATQRGFELIAPHLFPESDEHGNSEYPRAVQFDSDSLVNAAISNLTAQNFSVNAEMHMGIPGYPRKKTMAHVVTHRQAIPGAPRAMESADLSLGAKPDLSSASFMVDKQPFQAIKQESSQKSEASTEPKMILEQAIQLAVKIHAPNDEKGSKRKRTNYSVMSAAEERIAREQSKKRRASLKCKREKIRRTTLNTLMDEIRKELGLPQETVDQANILSHALSYIRTHKLSARENTQRFR